MVSFTGLNSVMDRTVFTNKGPIVKKPLQILTGTNLQILNTTDVSIPTANFTSSNIGYGLTITGSSSNRNDGKFIIDSIISSTILRLSRSNFNISDITLTTNSIITIANDIKNKYESHRTESIDKIGNDIFIDVHGINDIVNIITAPDSFDLISAITLLNDIRIKFNAHVIDVSGIPSVHKKIDIEDIINAPISTGIKSAIDLANDIRSKYENHRKLLDVHYIDDSVNIINESFVKATTEIYPGPFTGPFTWILEDLQLGIVADSSIDVNVLVNGISAPIDAVFGLLGAIVLQTKPVSTDTVIVDYNYMGNPPARFLRLNSPEFNLNQFGNKAIAGFPQHRYRSSSHIIDPSNSPDLMSPIQPEQIGWKYKGIERTYTASLNDPTSLLLNVPTNKVMYPVLFEKVPEITIKYDPIFLPHKSIDKWILNGDGIFSLAPGGNELTIIDQNSNTGPSSMPPFFHHEINIKSLGIISSAFRVMIKNDSSLTLDGVFTGVTFGISNGIKTAIVGFIITEATNLTSAIVLVNSIKLKFNAHLINPTSHSPDDVQNIITIVDATSLQSLIILANKLKISYSSHIAKGGGPGLTHKLIDITNVLTSSDAKTLDSSITLINELKILFNAHRTQTGIHFFNDTLNEVFSVKQVGILTNSDFPEFSDSWSSFAQDWTEFVTYRLSFNIESTANLYKSGDVEPGASVKMSDLPSLSNVDAKFDLIEQVFFGPIGRESRSTSMWQFIRSDIIPIDSNLIEDNKSIDYEAATVPELDSISPWITLGQEGFEHVVSTNILMLDSTASTPLENISKYGMTSGNFRGFTRLEPIMGGKTAAAVEFKFSSDWYTHGIDNNSMCIVLDDHDFSIQLSFIQYAPSAATVLGTTVEPFLIVTGDELIIKVEDNISSTISFSNTDTTASLIVSKINLVLTGLPIIADVIQGKIRFTSTNLGVNTNFKIISGKAIAKLGFSAGLYSGSDSTSEPKISWFGGNFPDLDDPIWMRGGNQISEILNRTMRITDNSITDYLTFNQNSSIITNQAFNSIVDWKLDFRIRVISFVQGTAEIASAPYSDMYFSGVLASIDEGVDGKNVEIHLVVDSIGIPFINLLSYNQITNSLDIMSQYAFIWNDNKTHSFNIYTSKTADMIIVLADGKILSPNIGASPTYSGLNNGIIGPSIAFGSGSEIVSNANLKSSKSVVDWESFSIFRDNKVNSSNVGSRRYIGIYQGGNIDELNSYALHQIDWSIDHTYRIVRNPVTAVSVYIDGGVIPVISIPYDVLALPPVKSSFLKVITSSHPSISFGAFNPRELSRSRWEFFRYSIGKISLTDRLIPSHQLINKHNVITSPDHLFTKKIHSHEGFTQYSGGTPTDDFMNDATVSAYTVLNDSTPPIQMTQNLESRGGFNKIAIPANTVSAVDFVNTNGYITDLNDDTTNNIILPIASDLSTSILLVNDIKLKYLSHLTQYRVHLANDIINNVLPINAFDLTSAIELAVAEKKIFNQHISATIKETQKVHSIDDVINIVSSTDSTTLSSLIILLNDIYTNYESHLIQTGVHSSTLFIRLDKPSRVMYESVKFFKIKTGTNGVISPFSDDETLYVDGFNFQKDSSLTYSGNILPENSEILSVQTLANDLRIQYNAHRIATGVHILNDTINIVTAPIATDETSSFMLLDDIKSKFNSHLIQSGIHTSNDPRNSAYPASPTVIKMAQSLSNELKFKYGRHIINISAHLTKDNIDIVTAPDSSEIESLGWVKNDSGPGTPDISLLTAGTINFLRYGTTVSGPIETVYGRKTAIPDDPSVNIEVTVSLRINSYLFNPNVNTGIYAGMISKANPGISVAIGFDAINDIPYVKLQDMNIDASMFRVPFDWSDGQVHKFKIVKDSEIVSLIIIS